MTERRSQSNSAIANVLRNPFAVATAALASFLVVLVLMTARLMSGHDPALHASTPAAALVARGGTATLRTTPSGRVIGPAAGETAAQTGNTQLAALVTRASGGAGAGARDD